MKNLPLIEIYEIIGKSDAVILDGDILAYHSLDKIRNEGHNVFLYVDFESGGLQYNLYFKEKDNQIVNLSEISDYFTLVDVKGYKYTFRLLKIQPIA